MLTHNSVHSIWHCRLCYSVWWTELVVYRIAVDTSNVWHERQVVKKLIGHPVRPSIVQSVRIHLISEPQLNKPAHTNTHIHAHARKNGRLLSRTRTYSNLFAFVIQYSFSYILCTRIFVHSYCYCCCCCHCCCCCFASVVSFVDIVIVIRWRCYLASEYKTLSIPDLLTDFIFDLGIISNVHVWCVRVLWHICKRHIAFRFGPTPLLATLLVTLEILP